MRKRPDLTLRNKIDNPAWSEVARRKISDSRKGKPTSLGIPCSIEKRAKISASLKGKPTGRRPSEKSIKAFAEAGKKNLAHGKGENHPNWKGGMTYQRVGEFHSAEYKNFVKIVLERDKYTCQTCGTHNGNGEVVTLQVHHIKPYAELSKEDRYNPDYGQVLCWHCHNLTKSHNPRPNRIDFVPRCHTCAMCGKEYRIKNPGKYCPICRVKYCCPVCGSTVCTHSARKSLNQPALF